MSSSECQGSSYSTAERRLPCISDTAHQLTSISSVLALSSPPGLRPPCPSSPARPSPSKSRTRFRVSVDHGGPVKISFFGLPALGRLTAPLIAPNNGVQVASLLDLAGTKAAVVQQRAEAKDYLDIDALLNDCRVDLPAALVCAREIYGPLFNPQLTLKALSFFSDGNLHRLPRDLQDRLARAAREVDLDRLPGIADLVRSFGQDFRTKP
jgi:hypothetical protein